MSVLVLGFASYPSALPDLGQDITNSQLPLGNVAFAQEEIKVELKEEIGISDEEETEEEDEEEIELKGKLTVNPDGTFDLDTGDGIVTISINADTEIDDGLSLSDLNGLEVEVEAVEIDGVLFATEIELEEYEDDEENGEKEKKGPLGDETEMVPLTYSRQMAPQLQYSQMEVPNLKMVSH